MYKRATHDELFSELFVYELGKALGMNMAVYEKGKGCIKSLDFTDGAFVNFEPAHSFMGDNEDYSDVIRALKEICPDAIPDYVRLIFLDTVVANPDRHTNNFGLLRDTVNGKLLGFAPNYDNNMALISRGYPKNTKSGDILITLFNDLMDEYPEFKEYIPHLDEDIVKDVLAKVNMRVKSKEIVQLVMKRYELIQKL